MVSTAPGPGWTETLGIPYHHSSSDILHVYIYIYIEREREREAFDFRRKSHSSLYGSCNQNPLPVLATRQELGTFLEALRFSTGVELGVQRGNFAADILSRWTSAKRYILVDLWEHQKNYHDVANVGQQEQDRRMNEALKQTSRFQDKIEICRNYTIHCATQYPDEIFDFVYVDARHDYKGVLEDMRAWWPKLKEGGIMSGHDYLDSVEVAAINGQNWSIAFDGTVQPENKAVRSAVNEFAEEQMLHLQVTYRDSPWNTWYFQKPKCNLKMSFQPEAICIVLFTCNLDPEREKETKALMASLLLNSATNSLEVNFMTCKSEDVDFVNRLRDSFSNALLERIKVRCHKLYENGWLVRAEKALITWKVRQAHHSGIGGVLKFFLPFMLKDRTKVILLDTDMIIGDDISKLWRTFDDFSGSMAAFPPLLGRPYDTFCSCSAVLNLERMRHRIWKEEELYSNDGIIGKSLKNIAMLTTGDQTLYNAINKSIHSTSPNGFGLLNPSWNLLPADHYHGLSASMPANSHSILDRDIFFGILHYNAPVSDDWKSIIHIYSDYPLHLIT